MKHANISVVLTLIVASVVSLAGLVGMPNSALASSFGDGPDFDEVAGNNPTIVHFDSRSAVSLIYEGIKFGSVSSDAAVLDVSFGSVDVGGFVSAWMKRDSQEARMYPHIHLGLDDGDRGSNISKGKKQDPEFHCHGTYWFCVARKSDEQCVRGGISKNFTLNEYRRGKDSPTVRDEVIEDIHDGLVRAMAAAGKSLSAWHFLAIHAEAIVCDATGK